MTPRASRAELIQLGLLYVQARLAAAARKSQPAADRTSPRLLVQEEPRQ